MYLISWQDNGHFRHNSHFHCFITYYICVSRVLPYPISVSFNYNWHVQPENHRHTKQSSCRLPQQKRWGVHYRLWAVLTVVGFKGKDSQTGPSEQSCETGVFRVRLCSIQLQKRMPPLKFIFMILKGLPCSQYLHFKIEVLVKYEMYKQCNWFLYFLLL